MTKEQALSTLIKIASDLALCINLPSDVAEDYQRHTYSAARVAAMMVRPINSQKDMAYEIRRCVDVLRGKEPPR